MNIMTAEQNIIEGIPIVKRSHRFGFWVPSLYFMKGLPYAILFMTSLVFLNRRGLSNGAITLTISWLLVPFVMRPILGRFIVGYLNPRLWILILEGLLSISISGIALTSVWNQWFVCVSTLFMFMSILTTCHDVAVSQLYKREVKYQARAIVFDKRKIFFVLSLILGFAIPISLAGNLEVLHRNVRNSWSTTFWLLSLLSLVFFCFHLFCLPRSVKNRHRPILSGVSLQWCKDVANVFLKQRNSISSLSFILFYLVSEGMFFRVAPLFLIDPGSNGGLSLSPQELGLTIGTIGTFGCLLGLSLGIKSVRRNGLKQWLWTMTLAITLPKALFIFLSYFFVSDLAVISLCVFIISVGTGFGITAYLTWMFYCTRYVHPAFSYSLGTALMSLSLLLSGLLTGFLQEYIGYRDFFVLSFFVGSLSFVVSKFLSLEDEAKKLKGLFK